MIWLALACENIDGAVLSPLRRGILDGKFSVVMHADAGAGLETLVKVVDLQRYMPAPRAAGEQLKEGSLGEPALCNIHRWYSGRSDSSGSKGSSGGDAVHLNLSEKDHD